MSATVCMCVHCVLFSTYVVYQYYTAMIIKLVWNYISINWNQNTWQCWCNIIRDYQTCWAIHVVTKKSSCIPCTVACNSLISHNTWPCEHWALAISGVCSTGVQYTVTSMQASIHGWLKFTTPRMQHTYIMSDPGTWQLEAGTQAWAKKHEYHSTCMHGVNRQLTITFTMSKRERKAAWFFSRHFLTSKMSNGQYMQHLHTQMQPIA